MAKKTDLQIAAEFYTASAILSILGVLPRRTATALGVILGKVAYRTLRRLRTIGLKNTSIAFPDRSESERSRLVRECFVSLGRQLGEVSQFPKITMDELKELVEIDVPDSRWEMYYAAKERGQGVLFLTPHLGGWEVMAFALSAIVGPQSYLVRRLDNPRLEALTESIRGRFGNTPIDKKNAAIAALRVLRSGENLGILPDLNTQRHEGVFVPFFGIPACTTSGVSILALRTDSMITVGSALWDDKKRKYVITFSDPVEIEPTGDREQDMIELTAKYTKEIEDLIRRAPGQWMWIHRRWKTRPEGEPAIY